MPVTGYKRFQTIDSQGGWFDSDPSSFLDGNDAAEIYFGVVNPFVILSNIVSFGVPSNATITGIEGNITIAATNGSLTSPPQIWSGKPSLNALSEGDLTDTLISIETSVVTGAKYSFGGEDNLFGLSLTPENVDNLRLGFKLTDSGMGGGTVLGIVYGESGDGADQLDTPSPALRIHYTLPSPPSKGSTNKAIITPEIKGPFQTSKLDRLTSGLSLQGGDTNPAPQAATKIKVDPLLLDKFNKEGGIPTSPTTAPNSITDTQNAQRRASTSTLNKPRLNPVDRDSETGLTNTDEAPLFTKRRFDPL